MQPSECINYGRMDTNTMDRFQGYMDGPFQIRTPEDAQDMEGVSD